jgi:hypothetical protein
VCVVKGWNDVIKEIVFRNITCVATQNNVYISDYGKDVRGRSSYVYRI